MNRMNTLIRNALRSLPRIVKDTDVEKKNCIYDIFLFSEVECASWLKGKHIRKRFHGNNYNIYHEKMIHLNYTWLFKMFYKAVSAKMEESYTIIL